MRKLLVVALVASMSLLGYVSAAGATSMSFEWTGTTGTGAVGGSSINVSNVTAETLTLNLIMNGDGAGVSSMFMSLVFDTDGGNELNVLSYAEGTWSNPKGTRTLTSLNSGIQDSQESQDGGPEGQLFTFEATTLGNGLKNATMVFATVVFQTNPGNVGTDGDDVFSGFFNTALDGAFDDGGNYIGGTTAFGGASVNVPEPGILALMGVGVGALLLAGRRRS